MRMQTLSATFALYLLGFGAPAGVYAQSASTIRGKVFNSEGHVVSGASVGIEGTRYWGITNDEGQYRITGVPVGQYDVFVRHQESWSCRSISGVVVVNGKQAVLDVRLREGMHCDMVVVEYEPPLLLRDPFASITWFYGHSYDGERLYILR